MCHVPVEGSRTAVVGSRKCASGRDANVRNGSNFGIAYGIDSSLFDGTFPAACAKIKNVAATTKSAVHLLPALPLAILKAQVGIKIASSTSYECIRSYTNWLEVVPEERRKILFSMFFKFYFSVIGYKKIKGK